MVCERYKPQGKGRFQSKVCHRTAYRRLCSHRYRKHPEIKNKLIIDEETRWIVEKIFDLAIHGRGAASITRILIAEKVPTPGFINFQRDGTFANIYAGAPEEKSYAWTIAQVKSIMKDETYIGHTIHYRETNISFKNKRRIRKPQSDWFV